MRELTHLDEDAVMPPPMAAPMEREHLARISTDSYRFQGEIDRLAEQLGPLWARQAHRVCESFNALVITVMVVRDEPEQFSVKVVD